jgi:hypothetical protein
MKNNLAIHTCKNCGNTGKGNYCFVCGQSYSTHRIIFGHLVEEVFHFFTHFEKGFGYTVKQLLQLPGTMQKKYLEGHRMKFQKPFSMFFLCATACGLAEYWINFLVEKYYSGGDPGEIYFFQHYLVITQVCLVPLYALVTWLCFIRFKYNYAEMLVLTLYICSFFFLLITPINCLKFIWPHLNTRYIELPILTVYTIITFLNLFSQASRLKIILISCISIIVNYTIVAVTQYFIVHAVHK